MMRNTQRTTKQTSATGYLYAIESEGMPFIKIGRTKGDLEKRLRDLQTGHPFPLTVLASIHLENLLPEIEQQLHTVLASQRRHGEWFALTMDAEQFLSLVEEARRDVLMGCRSRGHRIDIWLPEEVWDALEDRVLEQRRSVAGHVLRLIETDVRRARKDPP